MGHSLSIAAAGDAGPGEHSGSWAFPLDACKKGVSTACCLQPALSFPHTTTSLVYSLVDRLVNFIGRHMSICVWLSVSSPPCIHDYSHTRHSTK